MQAGLRRPSSARNPGQIVFRSRMSHLCDKPDRWFVTEAMRKGCGLLLRCDRAEMLSCSFLLSKQHMRTFDLGGSGPCGSGAGPLA